MNIHISDYIISLNYKDTKLFYDKEDYITDNCGCDYCKNYFLACEQLDLSTKILFNSLGIDPQKEAEVMHLFEDDDFIHHYSVFYHFSGKIINGPLFWLKQSREVFTPNFIKFNDIEIGFTESLSIPPDSLAKPIVQLEIKLSMPWLLTN